MSRAYAAYSRQEIDGHLFIRTIKLASGHIVSSDGKENVSEDRLMEGYLGDGAVGGVNVYLCRDPMAELYEDEDQELFDALGGKPVAKIAFEPGSGVEADTAMIEYLSALADQVEFMVTNFDDVLMSGEDVKAKKALGWQTLEPAS